MGVDALRHASNELRNDEEFVLKIIESLSNNASEEKMEAVPPVFFELENCLKLLPESLKYEPRFREEVERIIIDRMKEDPDELDFHRINNCFKRNDCGVNNKSRICDFGYCRILPFAPIG